MNKEQALSKAMKFCSTKEYAPSEMILKIKDWGLQEEFIPWVIEQLEAEKFIDEFRMARYFTNDKLKFNKWGKVKIRFMLQQKGVNRQAITEALDQINMEEYTKILQEEIGKKRKAIKHTDDYTTRAKLFQFASGRGFEAEMIYRFIGQ